MSAASGEGVPVMMEYVAMRHGCGRQRRCAASCAVAGASTEQRGVRIHRENGATASKASGGGLAEMMPVDTEEGGGCGGASSLGRRALCEGRGRQATAFVLAAWIWRWSNEAGRAGRHLRPCACRASDPGEVRMKTSALIGFCSPTGTPGERPVRTIAAASDGSRCCAWRRQATQRSTCRRLRLIATGRLIRRLR